jgi:RNA polymerase sigma-70 factor (ECF subfamily)
MPDQTQELLERAGRGDRAALDELFARHRDELRRAIARRLDRRVAARADASDVLQDTLLEAARRLPEALRRPDVPFHLWLRWLARDQVAAAHRRHLGAERRSAGREIEWLGAASSAVLGRALLGRGPSPSRAVADADLAGRVRQAMAALDDDERELIVWRHFEQVTIRDAALLLGIGEAAASKRYLRALERLEGLLHALGVTSAG